MYEDIRHSLTIVQVMEKGGLNAAHTASQTALADTQGACHQLEQSLREASDSAASKELAEHHNRQAVWERQSTSEKVTQRIWKRVMLLGLPSQPDSSSKLISMTSLSVTLVPKRIAIISRQPPCSRNTLKRPNSSCASDADVASEQQTAG